MASASATPTAIPGVSSPLEHITADDQGGLIAIMTALAWTFVITSYCIRVHVRYTTAPWKRDDNVITVATIFATFQSALVFYQVHKGLGKSNDLLSSQDIISIQKSTFAGYILFIISLFLSKASLTFLYARLTPARGHSRAVWTIFGGTAVWMVMSIMLLSIRCHVGNPWATWSEKCSGFFLRWQVIGALDIVTELSLFAMSIYLVKGLQMSMKAKSVVVCAFGSRLFVIPAIALHLHYLAPGTLSHRRHVAGVLAVVCAQLELGYGLMAATIPCLKPFVAAYEGRAPGQTTYGYGKYGYGNHSNGKYTGALGSQASNSDFKLESYTNGNGAANTAGPRNIKGIQKQVGATSTVQSSPPGKKAYQTPFRPDQPKYTATVSAREAKSGGSHGRTASSDSRQMIIETKTGWSVEYDKDSLRGQTNEGVIGEAIGERPSQVD